MLVIDSFRALRYQSRDEAEFEGFIHELAGRLTTTGTMALWLGEYSQDELATRPEFAIADAAIVLATEENGQRESRALRVLKLRGSGFRSGAHAYRIGVDGVEVFPRLSDVDATPVRVGPTAREFGHPRPRPAARRRILAGLRDPGHRPVGLRKDRDGVAVHLRRGARG